MHVQRAGPNTTPILLREMDYPAFIALLASTCFAGCGDADSRPVDDDPGRMAITSASTCEVVQAAVALPREIEETSGLARGINDPARFWTHNDAGHAAELFAIGASGGSAERVRVAGAESVDWEDIEAAPCEAGACLYIGDIGDNDAGRARITIYRIPEPAAGATETEHAEALHARFADGPRDAEALFAVGGDLYIVNKGRNEAIALYRYRGPQRTDETVTLERLRELLPQPHDKDDFVTAATATPDGRWVGVRTYRTLYVYPAPALVGGGTVEPLVFDLSSLGEAQGEGLAMADDGTVWVSSEADGREDRPRWSHIRCAFDV